MCSVIFINRGDTVIETIRDFEKHYGINPDKYVCYGHLTPLERDCCLCQMDVEDFFKDNPHLNGQYDAGEWYADA